MQDLLVLSHCAADSASFASLTSLIAIKASFGTQTQSSREV